MSWPALVHAGVMPELPPKEAFFLTAEFLAQPGVFGLIMAALTAALMSTVDTLVTAVSAIVVNDIYKPRNPQASEKQLLKMARYSALGVSIIGVGLVPIFADFKSVCGFGAFTAAITPPLVVALLFGVFGKGILLPLHYGQWWVVRCDILFHSLPEHNHPICTWRSFEEVMRFSW